MTELPRRDEHPRSSTGTARWKPHRAGILNVWRYYDEVFEFHNGRLLLRGPNGTGKSKALELLLPYLLDASLRPYRLSTFGTGERTMWWNLMGEGATGTTRVGYVWLEFTREGKDGPEWFCCGARLQASQHTKTPNADYFTTSRRIGAPDGMSLTNDSDAPLTKAALQEALGEDGILHPNGTEYRMAVRHALFPELTEQRYEALVTALLQLRQPKLSERLDPVHLSKLLSSALPALGHTEISELAEGFERLDRQREQLRQLDEEVDAAKAVATRQATYSRRVLRAGSATLISATTEMDDLTRRARESEAQHRRAIEQRAEITERTEALRQRGEELEARIQGLTDSEEYKQGKELDTLRQQAQQAQETATAAHGKAEEKQRSATADRDSAATAERSAQQAAEQLTAARGDADQSAHHAGLRSVAEEIATALESRREARPMLNAAVNSKKEQISHVLRAVRDYENAVERRRDAETHLETSRAHHSRATARHAELAEAYQAEVAAQAERLRRWADSTVELRFDDVDALAEQAESETAVLRMIDPVSQAAVQAITEEKTTTSAQRDSARQDHDIVSGELEWLKHATDLAPDPPPTRTADRSTMDGAPLWRLVSFRDGTPSAAQPLIEAALQASGLLDAWVPTSGTVDVTEHDTFLDIDRIGPVAGRSLGDVLAPEPDAIIRAERISRLLTGIAYGPTLPVDEPIAIGADGRWRMEVATGSWSKSDVAHIGAAARERARQRRIDELNRKRVELEGAIGTLDERLTLLAERRTQLDRDVATRPGYAELNEAHEAVRRAEANESAADSAVRDWVATLEERQDSVGAALRTLTALAAENGLPAEREALDRLHDAVERFRDSADTWLERSGAHAHARRHGRDAGRVRQAQPGSGGRAGSGGGPGGVGGTEPGGPARRDRQHRGRRLPADPQ